MAPNVREVEILTATEGRGKHGGRRGDTDDMVKGLGSHSGNLRLIPAGGAIRGQKGF